MTQGSLTINSVALTGFVVIEDLSPLWGQPTLRGKNVVIPGTAGQRAYPKTVDETDYLLPMRISHTVDHSGGALTHPDGLYTNLAYLWTNVLAPTIGTTVSATLTLPSGSTLSAAVQPQLSDPGRVPEHLGKLWTRYTLYLTVPAGRFA